MFFDPLADKLLILSAFISFLYIDLLANSIYLWMVVIIAFRDVSITLLRIIIDFKGDYTLVTSKIAKLKTTLQIIVISFVLLCLIFSSNYFELIYYLMIITTLVTLYTGIHYYYNNGKKLIQILSKK